MKKRPKLAIIFALFGLGCLGLYLITIPGLDHLGNFNSLQIIDNNIIDKEKLSILVQTEGKGGGDILVYDKGFETKIPEAYGPNRWFISYNDSLYCNGGTWNFNRNYDHDYALSFYKNGKNVFCYLDIKGKCGRKEMLKMTTVKKP